MSAYFVVTTKISDSSKRELYNEYIEKVKPIAESYDGVYIVRSEKISFLSKTWNPDRVIIIEFPTPNRILTWLSSSEYKEIANLRLDSVFSEAIIVESD